MCVPGNQKHGLGQKDGADVDNLGLFSCNLARSNILKASVASKGARTDQIDPTHTCLGVKNRVEGVCDGSIGAA